MGASQPSQTGSSLKIHFQKKLPGLQQSQGSVDLESGCRSVSDIPICLATTSYIDSKSFPASPSIYSLEPIYEEPLIQNEILGYAKMLQLFI